MSDMADGSTQFVIHPEGLIVPGNLTRLDRFRAWCRSSAFPERGRIDWIHGRVEIDMAGEDLNTHGLPKVAIARGLSEVVEDQEIGVVLCDATRVSVEHADLSVEPDVIVLTFESVESGHVKLVPKVTEEEGRYVEIEGAPDLVVECISDSSKKKDAETLFAAYALAGVGEYWLVDARGASVELAIHELREGSYCRCPGDEAGFIRSPTLDVAVRLRRLPARAGLVRHRLERR